MKFWPRYIGDLKKKTGDLSLLEKGAYTELLDYCYANECPLPLEPRRIWAIAGATTEAERKAVDKVTVKYFSKNCEGWVNERVTEELGKWRMRSDKAKKKANKRWGKPEGETT